MTERPVADITISSAAETALTEMIKKDGPMKLSHFIQLANSDPSFGYYSRHQAIGKTGDFITAPEISGLFGEMMAAFLTHIWQLFGQPAAHVAEVGPGRGTLLKDMYQTYGTIAPDLARAPIHLIEASQHHKTAIEESLPEASLAWHSSSAEMVGALEGQPLFGIGNEFLDALGVDQAIYQAQGWAEYRVDIAPDTHDSPFWMVAGGKLAKADSWHLPRDPKIGDIAEHSPFAAEAIAPIARHIAQFGGAFLLVDYGYETPSGSSLQAVQNHQPVPFFKAVGAADLTHLVDFSALKKTVAATGARLVGPVGQGVFLRQLGIEARAERLRQPGKTLHDRALFAALDRLISPAQMGDLFKVCVILPQGEGLPPGFAQEAG